MLPPGVPSRSAWGLRVGALPGQARYGPRMVALRPRIWFNPYIFRRSSHQQPEYDKSVMLRPTEPYGSDNKGAVLPLNEDRAYPIPKASVPPERRPFLVELVNSSIRLLPPTRGDERRAAPFLERATPEPPFEDLVVAHVGDAPWCATVLEQYEAPAHQCDFAFPISALAHNGRDVAREDRRRRLEGLRCDCAKRGRNGPACPASC